MVKEKQKILLERMHILLNQAITNARSNPSLASNQALLARKIATKNRVPIPYEMKISFCKKCKNFIAPGINSRIRIGRTSLKSIRITCLLCGHTYRKVIE
ncbi:MAG: RNase P subunit [Candidatus Nitrosoabyssus spongiisocia]|nr:MAG: RNase P subunit [Nitrosopumilaceae archaeon AB1(1)]